VRGVVLLVQFAEARCYGSNGADEDQELVYDDASRHLRKIDKEYKWVLNREYKQPRLFSNRCPSLLAH
jgi:hypothetical protein